MEATSVPQTHERVLILDDEPSQLKTLTALLEEEGFRVLACSRAAEALKALAQGDVAVAVVDLRLPDLGTEDLLNALVAWSDRVPIIINTAFASYDSARDAVNLGAFAYVEKAGNPADLVRHVHRAFQSRLLRYAEKLEQAVYARTRELQAANAALRESEVNYRTIFEQAGDYVLMLELGPDGIPVIVDVNKSGLRAHGYSREELLGKPISFLDPELTPELNAEKVRIAREGRILFNVRHRHKNGSVFDVEVRAQVVQLGTRTLFLTIERDITERKAQEQRILDYQRQLKDLASELTLAEERLRREVAAQIHDEISQTLAMSKVQVEALREAVSDDPLRASLTGIIGSLEQTLRDARDLTAQLSYPTLTVLGIEKAVEKWLFEEVGAKHGLETVFDHDLEDKPLDDDVRAVLFRSVRELLTNVVKHAHATRVVVSMQRRANQVVTVIEDDGVGCDPGEMMTGSRGFGILSIRESLERLGGELHIESHRGAGCKVTVKGPLKVESPLKSEVSAR